MTTQIIEYNVTQAAIAELTQEKETLLAASELDYKAIKDAKNRNGKIRIAIEKRRKEYKADALEYGRKVDSKAKESSDPVTAIEDAYKDVLNKRDAELEAVRVEAMHKENARIAAIEQRIEGFLSFKDNVIYNTTAAEIESIIAEFDEAFVEKFDYAEFKDKALESTETTMEFLRTKFEERTVYESEQAEQESQRKKDNEARIALQAEKDAFEQEQKDAQAKIDFELAAIQKEKDDLQRAEIEREEKRQQEIHETKMQEAKEQLAKQRAIDEEMRIKAKKAEDERLEQVAKEDAERKVTQAAEDRVRNAAPDLLEALEGMVKMYEEIQPTGGWQGQYEESTAAIKLAKGE